MRTFENYKGANKVGMTRMYLTMKNEIDRCIISEQDVKAFALALLDDIPDYFFSVPASSSGKYHPETDLGFGGLVRHSINVSRMLEHLLGVTADCEPRTHDLLMVAALFHDCMKSGSQQDYEKNPHTRFIHPILAATFIQVEAVKHGFNYNDARMIADVVSSHMGRWNEKKGEGTLPLPESHEQKFVHLADYLASRKGVEMPVEEARMDQDARCEAEMIGAVLEDM